ncbi:hypothetical protein P3342_011710 [Pyrenophora teres f. teres]|uniref:Uncharacterized protein n=1 Tax=Pyrenophora teres f. teres (strain 0-1) TaxID=861557 RepID=E3RUG4_PYRTT|nr:hypothetical protein PTT_12725 [Pyrenophora teres f. teres 0-1]KAK1911108.1 hypothetical protein P3342_011710 [Pyrenophora teres f. teres]
MRPNKKATYKAFSGVYSTTGSSPEVCTSLQNGGTTGSFFAAMVSRGGFVVEVQ